MDTKRVVEIDCDRGYGSGYLVAPGVVLTARHVFEAEGHPPPKPGLACKVRAVGKGKRSRPDWDEAELVWAGGEAIDVAILHSNTRDRSHKLPRIARPQDGPAEIKCRTIGFPKATRTASGEDDTYQLDGVMRTATFSLGADLSVDVISEPPRDPESWPGLSGAALFAGDRLLGVIRSYPREFGGRVLKATPLSAVADDPEVCAALSTPCPLLLDEIGDTTADSRQPRPPRPVRYSLPSLPEHYQERPDALEAVRQQLLGDARTSTIVGKARNVGVHGMGGIGKTVLATAVVHDPQIEAAFPDGICWLTFGREGDPRQKQAELAHALTGTSYSFQDREEGRGELSQITQTERLLVVLDDVWTGDQVDAFSRLGPYCRVLVTTRDRRVRDKIGGAGHELDLLSREAALAFLVSAAGSTAPETAEVAKECGHLPLALASVGALIANGDFSWPQILARLRQADIKSLQAALPDYEHEGIFAALAVSVSALSGPECEAFLDCAIFPEDIAIPEAVLLRLWSEHVGDDVDPLLIANRLVQLTLLRREERRSVGATQTTAGRSYRLHDLYRDYLVREAKPLPPRHEALLNAYWRDCPNGWTSFPDDDGYFVDSLPYHMARAERTGELRDLQFDHGWLRKKLAAREVNALIADTKLCGDDAEVDRLGRALRMSAHVLARDKRQLEAQLLGRLGNEDGERISHLLETARRNAPKGVLLPRHGSHLLPVGPLIATLEGHSDEIGGALDLLDGRVLSWSRDSTLRHWDLETGQCRTLEGHGGRVVGARALSDGRVLSWDSDSILRLWDLETGQGQMLGGHGDRIDGAMEIRGGSALSWSRDHTLRVWDLESGESQTLVGHKRPVDGVLILNDGRALSWALERTLWLWNLERGQGQKLQGHEDVVLGTLDLPDGRAVSWSRDRTLRVWDPETEESQALVGHEGPVDGVLILTDGRVLSWAIEQLRLWDLGSGESQALSGHESPVDGALALPDGRVLSWSWDGILRLWNLETGHGRVLEGHDRQIDGALVLPEGRALSWSEDGMLVFWDLETGKGRGLEGHERRIEGVTALPDGRGLSWSEDATLRVWDLESGAGWVLEGHGGAVHGTLVLSDSRALSWSEDGTLRLWDLESRESRPRAGHGGPIRGVVGLPDGGALSWSDDGTVRCWDLESGESWALEGHHDQIEGIVSLHDGRALLLSKNGALRLIDLNTGESQTLEGHGGPVLGALGLQNGRALSWSWWDRTVRLWDLDSGQSRALQRDENGAVEGVSGALSLPGGGVLLWSWDGKLWVWDLTTGEGRALECDDGVIEGVLAPSDSRALSLSKNGMPRVWDLESCRSRSLECGHGLAECALVLADGRILLWFESGALWLCDLDSGEARAIERDGGAVLGALGLPDGRALSWSWSSKMWVWDVDKGNSYVLSGHGDAVQGALGLADGRVLSWSLDGTLRLWDVPMAREIGCAVLDDTVTTCVLDDTGQRAIVGDQRGRLLVFDLP